MKKRYIAILIIIIMITTSLMILISCVKKDNSKVDNFTTNKDDLKDNNVKKSADKIQLWYYTGIDDNYTEYVLKIVDSAKKFCSANNIPLETFGYDVETLTIEDYKLKRNTAAASGNMIIIEDINYIRDLSKLHADYTKLDNYDKLLSAYRDRFCIPLGSQYSANYIETYAIQYYGISTDKLIITYIDYLKIKQEMKKKGAKFELNHKELAYLMNYYLHMNGLLYIDEESKFLSNNDNLKEILKKTILDILNEIILYYNGNLDTYKNTTDSMFMQRIYDKNSGLVLENSKAKSIKNLIEPRDFLRQIEDVDNKIFYYNPFGFSYSPSFFMHKKITNENIFDLANHIVSEETYLFANERYIYYAPIFNIDKAKDILKVNNNLEFVGEYEGDSRIREIINYAYEMLVKNENTSKEISKPT